MKSTKLVIFVNLLTVVLAAGQIFAAERGESAPRSERISTVVSAAESVVLPDAAAELSPVKSASSSAASTSADGVSLWQVFSGGATSGSAGQTVLLATLGQPVIGLKQADGVTLAQGFWAGGALTPRGCCTGRVGDVDGNGVDEPTIADVSTMVDNLYISHTPLWCLAEADANQSGGANPEQSDISLGDISYLIDYLFITGPPLGLPDCL